MPTDLDKKLENQTTQETNGHLKASAKRTYTLQQQRPIENDQIMKLIPMVHKIVQKVVTYLKPPLTYDDLISAGTVGLVKAAHDYDPSQQAVFTTYAYIRIRGAVLDELRGWSFVPANVDKQIRETIQASAKITEKTGSAPSDEELAEKLDITVEKLHKTYQNARAKNFLSIDNSTEELPSLSNSLASANTTTPDQQLEKRELVTRLTKAIQQLNERQRQVILLYYQQELTMKQIAEVFKITEPRVSQLHANAIFNLSLKLRQFENGR